ncbi:MAG: long-chain fatty acid--CoA ligase [Hyphomicrobiaceae bacterium]
MTEIGGEVPAHPLGKADASGRDVARAWLAAYPRNVDWDQRFEAKPLQSLLDDAAAHYPTAPCTNFFGRKSTYREIATEVDRVAAGLQRAGVSKGDKVGLFLPNCPAFIVYYYAILKAGGVVVNYNPLYTVEELAYQVKDSQTRLMVTLDLNVLFSKVDALMVSGALERAIVVSFPGQLPTAKAVLFKLFKGRELAAVSRSAAADRVLAESQLVAGAGAPAPVPVDAETDIAILQYTGGTTGTPKGAMLTHANAYINVMQVVSWAPELGMATERVMGVLPFFHVFAMTVVMNFGIARAAEIVIMPRFVLDDAMKLIDKTKPTVMPGVPTLFNAIMNHPKLKSYDLASLKFCLSGGAALPLEVKQRFERLTGCKVVEGYGLSETSPVATCNPLDGPVKEGSIGQPLPQTLLSLRALDDPTRVVTQGETGEICIAGPQVMKGYWMKPEETANAFVDGFLRTGDVGHMDEEGFFYITDRIKDLIICSGYNVYPRRIEEAIYEHQGVEEVTVIGIPDQYRGEAPKAFIKLKAGQHLEKADILRHLEPKLSRIEMPAEIEFRDSLPKTMIGKLSKKELKQEEAARHKKE